MKIEITAIRVDSRCGSGIHRVSVIARVPNWVKEINIEVAAKIFNERKQRLSRINELRKEKGKSILNFRKGLRSNLNFSDDKSIEYNFAVISWSPIMEITKLEILQKYL